MASAPFINSQVGTFTIGVTNCRVCFENDGDSASFTLAPLVGDESPASEDVGLPDDHGSLGQAARWLVELDGRASVSLSRGSNVERQLLRADPLALPSPQASWRVDQLRRLRQPAASLIRPLLKHLPPTEALFPYQVEGVDWLKSRRAGILADDMGLGKTLQAIVALRELLASGQIRWGLIVCPRSLMANWEAELEKWAPELSRLRVIPSATTREEAWEVILSRVHVIITNFEQLRVPPTALTNTSIPLMIVDEAHRIRNSDSQITSGIRGLKADRFWALTGTPVERDATDLATLLSLVDKRRFAPSDSSLPVSVLRGRARPLVLRRRKSEVLGDLPEVMERVETLELEPAQRESYEAALHRVGQRSISTDDTLRLLNQLRQICDYDSVSGASCKIDRIAEIINEIAEADEKAVIFSTLVRPLELLRSRLSSEGHSTSILTGDVKIEDRDEAVRNFKDRRDIVALLATTCVAGEGLTLTEANHVIFINEWWNPSTNSQARDRVVRIGQKRGVQVYRFFCKGTVEEALARVLSRKSELFNGLVDQLSQPEGPNPALIEELFHELRPR